jgi:hypothetical protein
MVSVAHRALLRVNVRSGHKSVLVRLHRRIGHLLILNARFERDLDDLPLKGEWLVRHRYRRTPILQVRQRCQRNQYNPDYHSEQNAPHA